MKPILINHRRRFNLWFVAGCLAFVGAGLKLLGVFDLHQMPAPGMGREMEFVYIVFGVGTALILYAITRIPRTYTFDEQGLTVSYLLWNHFIPWHEVSTIEFDAHDTTANQNIKFQVFAAIGGIPLIEHTALVQLRSGKTWAILVDEETCRIISVRWNKVWQKVR